MTFSELTPRGEVDSGWDSRRQRSSGVLTSAEIAVATKNGTALAYDPIQHGIVYLDCLDDIVGLDETRRDRPSRRSFASLSFRRWRLEDAGAFAALLGEPDVWRYLPDKSLANLDAATAETLIKFANDAGHHDVYAVEAGGELVGQARLLFDALRPGEGEAEISYWLGKPHWGKGLGSLIVATFTSDSFVRWRSLTSIFARVHRDNHASRRALINSGFLVEPHEPKVEWQVFRIRRS